MSKNCYHCSTGICLWAYEGTRCCVCHKLLPKPKEKEPQDMGEAYNKGVHDGYISAQHKFNTRISDLEPQLLTFIPRKMKTKAEEKASAEGYEHGIKTAIHSALEVLDV